MPKTMVTRIQESRQATNIYLTNEVALHLAKRLEREAKKNTGVRIVILNKRGGKPDIQVFAYPVK
jgi:Fe-S cluster assembly iron-binding protein IscA